jgi:hypothetical protein
LKKERVMHRRRLPTWLLAGVSAGAFVVGASASQAGPASRPVVTPDDPVFGVQDPAPPPQEQAPEAPPAPAGPTGPTGRGGRGGGPRPFSSVITSEARTDDGVFKVHRVGETVYYEIPRSELGKDFLWVTRIKRTTLGAGFGGQGVIDRVVRWEQQGNRVLLKLVNYDVVADPAQPIARAVADANYPAIVRAFNVAAISPIGSLVIDVTSLFTSEVAEFSARQNLGARGMDQSRSYIEKVVSFPRNINVQVTQTYTGAPDPTGRGRGMRGSSGTVVLFHSMVRLPDTPMMPRLVDERVGYFSTSTYDFGRDENKAVERAFILRHRLEKKDPSAAVSEPVAPIVYYVDPATPAKFVPWVKKGIEDWQPAFEAAGFRNAIVAKDAPRPAEEADWDPEDVRYSVVRWLPSTEENANGPNVHDPRSGEILEGDIQMYHNVLNLASMWYFAQVAPLDPRARTLPLPDDLMGRLVQFIVAHEVGHTLGLRHNMKASSLYSVAQIRDKAFVAEHGHTPSIMDYARFNYVAQPEDGVAAQDLVPKIGAYDTFALKWGYSPVPDATSPDQERPTLDRWAREQDTKPFLRFMTGGSSELELFPFDPGQQREAVGDANPVAATTLGLKNLARVSDLLVPATTRPGEAYDDLQEAYGRLVAQWRLELGHVANVVGGVDSREVYPGQPGTRFSVVPKAAQAAAVQFLLANGFRTPTFLTNPEILHRIEPVGIVARIRTAQTSLLNALLQPSRLDRLIEQSALQAGAYAPLELLADLRAGLWSELKTPARPIDIYRRNVQRAHLDIIDNRLNGGPEPTDEVRALLKGELRAVDAMIRTALPAVADLATRRHLQDARDTIATSLDPRSMRVRPAPPGAGGRGAGPATTDEAAPSSSSRYDFDRDPFLQATTACWWTPGAGF